MVVRLGHDIEDTLNSLTNFTCDVFANWKHKIKRQDMIPNTEVLKKCNMPGIEALLLQAQL